MTKRLYNNGYRSQHSFTKYHGLLLHKDSGDCMAGPGPFHLSNLLPGLLSPDQDIICRILKQPNPTYKRPYNNSQPSLLYHILTSDIYITTQGDTCYQADLVRERSSHEPGRGTRGQYLRRGIISYMNNIPSSNEEHLKMMSGHHKVQTITCVPSSLMYAPHPWKRLPLFREGRFSRKPMASYLETVLGMMYPPVRMRVSVVASKMAQA